MSNARQAAKHGDPAMSSVSRAPDEQKICVIGAGMSGLAAVDAFARAGFRVTCYEAGSAVGGMWRYDNDSGRSAAYASLEANTSKRRMQYPSFPQPESAPAFPHHSDMLAYLEAYAEANDLARHVRFRAVVDSAEPVDCGWNVTVAGERPRHFDWLVVATGHYWQPIVPQLSGAFTGETMHVREYRTPQRFAGKRVIVVGGAQSALDIAAEISSVAASVTLACDRVHHLLPRCAFGRPLDERDTAAALLVPLPVVRLVIHAITRLGRSTPRRGELPPPGHPLFQTRWPVIVSPTVEAALKEQAFACRPRVTDLDGDTVRFADGSETLADSVVFATGYEIGFPFLPTDLGRGDGWEFPLYRRIVSPHARRLAFIGVVEAGPGMFEIVERQSQWLAQFISGHLWTPTRDEMWKAIDAGERRSRRQFSSTGAHTIMCNRHAYLRALERDRPRAPSLARPGAHPSRGRRLPAAIGGARLQARMLRETAVAVSNAPANGELESIARARYALIVTYRRDGTPVATPVWAAVAGSRVYVRTERTSGKVKRLRIDPRALLVPCSVRGRPLGPGVRARGRLLGADEERVAETALATRYGAGRALFERTADAMRIDMAYLELTQEGVAESSRRPSRPAAGTSAAATS
jgi:dimethylaniline monooxygenase (N-oxide forming)